MIFHRAISFSSTSKCLRFMLYHNMLLGHHNRERIVGRHTPISLFHYNHINAIIRPRHVLLDNLQ